MLSKNFLDVLACPKCKYGVKYNKGKNILVCLNNSCSSKYEIDSDIPLMVTKYR